jgi:hypothetical protein
MINFVLGAIFVVIITVVAFRVFIWYLRLRFL